MPDEEWIRLNKYLSAKGICSRREADACLAAGRITVNGRTACIGEKVCGSEEICLDGRKIRTGEYVPVYLMLNKPEGIVCTTRNDPDNVIDFLHLSQRVFPIGRLDKTSSGLLLLTNDGSIVNGILRASNYHEKEYIVTVNRPVTRAFLDQMSRGVYLTELQVRTRPCHIHKTGSHTFSIILTQGLNRQIRRMCRELNYRVLSLQRIRIMNICLGDLSVGEWRYLTDEEKNGLQKQLSGKAKILTQEDMKDG